MEQSKHMRVACLGGVFLASLYAMRFAMPFVALQEN